MAEEEDADLIFEVETVTFTAAVGLVMVPKWSAEVCTNDNSVPIFAADVEKMAL
jgi:hypothetical protein